MAKLFMRIASASGLTALALVFVGLTPFLGDPTAGAGPAARTWPFSVNREFKGDRLPRRDLGVRQSEKPDKIPIGCESSFSPISAPRLAHVYGRCMT